MCEELQFNTNATKVCWTFPFAWY